MRVSLQQAAHLLDKSNVIGVPTETVYGLAAKLSDPQAISKIFSLKGRPANNPLIVHAAETSQVLPFIQEIPPSFHALANAFWPGPMTLVVPVKCNEIPSIVRAGLSTAAFRVPQHPSTRQLLAITGPLVMPSANLSGKPSSTSAQHVEEDFGKEFPVLDGGECLQGLESTILYFLEGKWTIIRQGAIPAEQFFHVLKYSPAIAAEAKGSTPLCPGQLYRHYAPQAQLLLGGPPPPLGAIIGFSDRSYPQGCRLFSLGCSNDPETAAQRLYSILRQLDHEGIQSAWVDMQFDNEGLWLTLKERLHKAAAAS